MAKQRKKKKKGLIVLIIIVIIVVLGLIGSIGNNDEEPQAEQENTVEITKNDSIDWDALATVNEIKNGSGTEVVATQSVIEMSSEDVDLDVLYDWYVNYVKGNDCDSCVIIYTDTDLTGAWAIEGIVQDGVQFELFNNQYQASEGENTVDYKIEDGKLVEW